MKISRDYLGLSNSCSYNVDDVNGRADRFGFQNFCNPAYSYSIMSENIIGFLIYESNVQ